MSDIVGIIVTGLMGYLTWYLKAQFSNKSNTAQAMRSLLRFQIYELHHRYMKCGEIDPQELNEFTELVEIYKSFNGNGSSARMLADVQNLPLQEGNGHERMDRIKH